MRFLFVLAAACGSPSVSSSTTSSGSSSLSGSSSGTTTSSSGSGWSTPSAAGFQVLADGSVNRVADVPATLADYSYGTSDCIDSNPTTSPDCTPSGCTERPNGRCASESCLSDWCTCVYACASDADCAADEACLRPEHGLDAGLPMPQCVPAGCRTGADCASGECGVTVIPASLTEELRLACRTPSDLCRVEADCESGELCSRTGDRWECLCSYCWCD